MNQLFLATRASSFWGITRCTRSTTTTLIILKMISSNVEFKVNIVSYKWVLHVMKLLILLLSQGLKICAQVFAPSTSSHSLSSLSLLSPSHYDTPIMIFLIWYSHYDTLIMIFSCMMPFRWHAIAIYVIFFWIVKWYSEMLLNVVVVFISRRRQ